MATEFKIKDGVLLECQTDETSVRIPEEVKYVSKHAFDSCENDCTIKMDLYPDHVADKLAERICRFQKHIMRPYHPRVGRGYHEYKQNEPSLIVWDVDSEQIEKAIGKAIEMDKKDYLPNVEWKTLVIEADRIREMTDTMAQVGRENLLSKHGETYSTMYDLPLIPYSLPRVMWSTRYEPDVYEWIERHGFGIVYIKGINKENHATFGHNFDYCLIKEHLFGTGRISPKWLIVIGTDTEVKLDEPRGGGWPPFSPYEFWMDGPKEYLEYMDSAGRLVD